MFSNTLKGIKADFKPMYVKTRSAGTAWLDTSRKYVSQKMHKAANMLGVPRSLTLAAVVYNNWLTCRSLLISCTLFAHSQLDYAGYVLSLPRYCQETGKILWSWQPTVYELQN